jgi:hypothetical protein
VVFVNLLELRDWVLFDVNVYLELTVE